MSLQVGDIHVNHLWLPDVYNYAWINHWNKVSSSDGGKQHDRYAASILPVLLETNMSELVILVLMVNSSLVKKQPVR